MVEELMSDGYLQCIFRLCTHLNFSSPFLNICTVTTTIIDAYHGTDVKEVLVGA